MTDAAVFEKTFTGRKLLITGSAGFLASGWIARVMELNCQVRCITRSPTAPATMRGGRASFQHFAGDIRDRTFGKKILAESHLEHYVRMGWARGMTLRLANLYGPGAASTQPDRGILNQMIRRTLRGEPLTPHGNGSQLRGYLLSPTQSMPFWRRQCIWKKPTASISSSALGRVTPWRRPFDSWPKAPSCSPAARFRSRTLNRLRGFHASKNATWSLTRRASALSPAGLRESRCHKGLT